ncbi:MAG: DUF4838 domain-containing protein [Lentisphaeria bacterium]|nr:DUF4838 domain-containing protein [Lentisphaeria bacterium]
MKRQMIFGIACMALSAVLTVSAAETSKTVFKTHPVSPRKIVIGEKPVITLCKDGKVEFEVVKPANPAANQAANELIARLAQITGKKVKPVAKASGKVPAFYLGTCPEAKALGLDPEKLDRDGYYIKTDGNCIFITGVDSNAPGWDNQQRATLFGVYEFLERFGGVRYYFPGEIGTIVPKKKDWTLPAIDITDRPDAQYRWIYCVDSSARVGLGTSKYLYPGLKNPNPTTWRNSTVNGIRSCHGLNDLELVKRFSKTHPEYFAMLPNGDRHNGTKITTAFNRNGHLCYSSEELKEVIYQDAAACLTGKPASSRGISRWASRWNTWHVDLAPNDGMYWCQCPKCKKIQEQGKQAMSDHIWGFVIDIANRLKKNGISGYVMNDSYGVFKPVPSMPVPDNVMVGVALSGPWSMRHERTREAGFQRLRSWSKAINGKVKIWTYPTKAAAEIPYIPNFTPRAVGAFYQAAKNDIFGSFVESGSDRWMFGFLNSYVCSKVLWDWNTDVEKLIDEHCRLMYGKAAPQMSKFYTELENLWMDRILGNIVQTSLGDNWKIPTRRDIWTKIYTPAKIKEIDALLDQAEKAVAKDPASLKRVKFMREQLWQPVHEGAKAFQAETADRTAWTLYTAEAGGKITLDGKLSEPAWKKAEAIWLGASRTSKKTEVQTRVKMLQDADYFYFGFEADEPETAAIIAETNRKPDDTEIWRDSSAEIFLSAELTSDFIYQFMFNAAGAKADLKNSLTTVDPKYESGFEVKTNVVAGKIWTAEVRIPRKAMPELNGRTAIVGNFTRHRVLKEQKIGTEFYAWFPKKRNIPEDCGNIRLDGKKPEGNLIKLADFEGSVHGVRHLGTGWSAVGKGAVLTLDNAFFVTKGASLLLAGNCNAVRQSIPVKPDKQYKLSFFIRTEKLNPGFRGIIRFGGDPAPARYILGNYRDYIRDSVEWYRVEKTFRTPKQFGTQYEPFVEFFISKSTGKCWIDHVELYEIPGPEKK